MRKKFRERKAQEKDSSTSNNVENNATVLGLEQNNEVTPTKSGDSSTVSLSELSYSYEKGSNQVTFSCSRLDNACDETTGLLSLNCWISEKKRENGNWQNDNYAFVDSTNLGSLEKGYGFPDINRTFIIPDDLVKIINDLNNDGFEWHFIFTVNELHEDGNNYIIHTINGQNENEGIRLPMLDDSVTVIKDEDEDEVEDHFVYVDGEEFTGTLYSSDERFEMEFKKSAPYFIVCYHKNGFIAVAGNIDDESPIYFDEQGNEINEDAFEKKYGEEFGKIMDAGLAELDSRVVN